MTLPEVSAAAGMMDGDAWGLDLDDGLGQANDFGETEQQPGDTLGDFGEMPDSAGFDMDDQQPQIDTADDDKENYDPDGDFSQSGISKPASAASTVSNSAFINTRATPGRSGKRKRKSSEPMMDATTMISSVRSNRRAGRASAMLCLRLTRAFSLRRTRCG